MRLWAVVLAGGEGRRFGGKKQFIEVNGVPLYRYSLEVLKKFVEGVTLVVPREDVEWVREREGVSVVEGGKERWESSRNGVLSVPDGVEFVLIHDASRPLISESLVKRVVEFLGEYDAVVPVIPSYDALKLCKEGFVEKTIKREEIFRAQTPQGFRLGLLKEAFSKAEGPFYDDAQVVEGFCRIKTVPGDALNIKITTREDLEFFLFLENKKGKKENEGR